MPGGEVSLFIPGEISGWAAANLAAFPATPTVCRCIIVAGASNTLLRMRDRINTRRGFPRPFAAICVYQKDARQDAAQLPEARQEQ